MGLPATMLPGYVPWTVLLTLPDMAGQDTTGYTVAHEWYFPGLPPAPVEIPYDWLAPPLLFRPDQPLTTAAVAQANGATAYATDTASRAEYGATPFTATLATVCDADPAALAAWIIEYYATPPAEVPRQRMSVLRLRLNGRTPTEQWRILGLTQGRRVSITGAPSRWPAGATEQIVEGTRHIIGDEARDVELMTSPVIGQDPGTAGPWFRLDYSAFDGPDLIPF